MVFKDGLLGGKVCVVTGSGTGIGRAIALELGSVGATVLTCGRRLELVEETARIIRAAGGSAEAAALDVRDDDMVASFFDQALARHGHVDVLINNAGGQFFAPAEETTPKGFRHVVELNLGSTYLMTYTAATKAFIPQGVGRIINISATPHTGIIGVVHNSAARAAIENMTRTLSLEWGRFGITLCSIAIGTVASSVVWDKYPEEWTAKWAGMTSVGRLGRPEEVAWLAALLSSDAASYITGTVVTIDGGRDNGPPATEAPHLEARTPAPAAG
jgi:citronellol/citronellal dehydrogenase